MKWFRSQAYYATGSPAGWRSRLETERGAMANQGVHYVDLIQWWLGPIDTVLGTYGTYAHDIEPEDAAAAIINFASGAKGVVVTTTTAFPDQGTSLQVGGDRGTISWKDQGVDLFRAVQGDAGSAGEWDKPEPVDMCIDDFPAPDDLPAHVIADVVGAITEGKPLQCDGHEGRKAVSIFEATYNSSDAGTPVPLP